MFDNDSEGSRLGQQRSVRNSHADFFRGKEGGGRASSYILHDEHRRKKGHFKSVVMKARLDSILDLAEKDILDKNTCSQKKQGNDRKKYQRSNDSLNFHRYS